MWPQYGTGTNQCLISIHTLCAKIGDNIRISLLKAHILTGSDVNSKVAALKKIPEFCLVKLGDKEVEGEGFRDAERYLVNVLQTNSQCTTFDELRYVLYIENLYLNYHHLHFPYMDTYSDVSMPINLQVALLLVTSFFLNPVEYGWQEQNSVFYPYN